MFVLDILVYPTSKYSNIAIFAKIVVVAGAPTQTFCYSKAMANIIDRSDIGVSLDETDDTVYSYCR